MCESSVWPMLMDVEQMCMRHCHNAHLALFQCGMTLHEHLSVMWPLHRHWPCAFVPCGPMSHSAPGTPNENLIFRIFAKNQCCCGTKCTKILEFDKKSHVRISLGVPVTMWWEGTQAQNFGTTPSPRMTLSIVTENFHGTHIDLVQFLQQEIWRGTHCSFFQSLGVQWRPNTHCGTKIVGKQIDPLDQKITFCSFHKKTHSPWWQCVSQPQMLAQLMRLHHWNKHIHIGKWLANGFHCQLVRVCVCLTNICLFFCHSQHNWKSSLPFKLVFSHVRDLMIILFTLLIVSFMQDISVSHILLILLAGYSSHAFFTHAINSRLSFGASLLFNNMTFLKKAKSFVFKSGDWDACVWSLTFTPISSTCHRVHTSVILTVKLLQSGGSIPQCVIFGPCMLTSLGVGWRHRATRSVIEST